MKKLFVPIIFGRAKERRISYTEKIIPIVLGFTKSAGLKTKVIDTATTGIHETSRDLTSQKKKKLSRLLHSAAGFILVSPEYNHSFSGELKIFLDSFTDEFSRKPVGIVAVSNGGIGGSRMVEQLRLVAIALKMVPINAAIHFTNAPKLFDAKGKLVKEKKEMHTERFTKFFGELTWYAKALKAARKK